MTGHIHVHPVDPSQTTEEAWKEICTFGRRVTYQGEPGWATTWCDGEECRLVAGEGSEGD